VRCAKNQPSPDCCEIDVRKVAGRHRKEAACWLSMGGRYCTVSDTVAVAVIVPLESVPVIVSG
jgi:hypothetical protein